ncbi:MAG: LuxR family transcriptional regulator [Modestobacter sp.]|nr:LuxR family transcriptional regulator [Modestobacter sp.]
MVATSSQRVSAGGLPRAIRSRTTAITGRSARTGRVSRWWRVPVGTHPWVALAVTTPAPGTARVGDAATTPSPTDGPDGSQNEGIPWFRAIAVAERECRRMAPDDDRVDGSRQKRYRPLGTAAGAGSGNRWNTTLFAADDGTRSIASFTGTMTAPMVDADGSLLPIEGTQPERVPDIVLVAHPQSLTSGGPDQPVPGTVIDRRALFGRLAGASRVTQITAPAGSGKTQLLRSWIGEAGLGERAGWVAVQRQERDAQRFLISVIEALGATAPGSTRVRSLTPAPDLDGWGRADLRAVAGRLDPSTYYAARTRPATDSAAGVSHRSAPDGPSWCATSARQGPCATSAAPSARGTRSAGTTACCSTSAPSSCASPNLHAVLTDDVRKAAAAPRLRPPGCAGRSGVRHRRADVMASSQRPGEGR